MIENYDSSLRQLLKHEGGWSEHPRDPGGATMKGVTLNTFRRFYGREKTKEELRNITHQQLAHIYKVGYWDVCQCDSLPVGLDFVVFDAAVNSGSRRSLKWLQLAVGSHPDGIIGPNTLRQVRRSKLEDVICNTCMQRLLFMQSLNTWNVFGKGWSKRVLEVCQKGLVMELENVR